MPINDYNGKTFIAYLDISGFKYLMGKKEAWKILDRFYNAGYNTINNQNNFQKVEGFFISDCGVLFVRMDDQSNLNCFISLLNAVKSINKNMLHEDIMLTTTISFGRFKYQNKLEVQGIEKNAIYGDAYVQSFIDNEYRKPKIKPGQCRIVGKDLPIELDNNQLNNNILKLIKTKENDPDHYYYYWNLDDADSIKCFEKDYQESYNSQYEKMLQSLKNNY